VPVVVTPPTTLKVSTTRCVLSAARVYAEATAVALAPIVLLVVLVASVRFDANRTQAAPFQIYGFCVPVSKYT
jgi:hypothetical protein